MNGIAAKRFSVLRSWDEIGIHDVDALTQKHVTKTEQLFYDSDFNFSIPVVKRGQFARQIGMKVLKQRYERLANIANVEIKAAQLHWHASKNCFCFHWGGISGYELHPVLLVGFFPDEVRVWKWDKKLASLCESRQIFVSGKVREEDLSAFDPNPGPLLARIPYSCKSSWRHLGFNEDFKTTFSQYQTKGGLLYASTPFSALGPMRKHILFSDISDRIVAFSPFAKELKDSLTITKAAMANLQGKNLCQFKFRHAVRDHVENVILIPYYPDRLEAFLCHKKDTVGLATENNSLFFYSSLDENGHPRRIEPPGHFLASLPFST
eukprot:GEMP01045578.1.p1 GENE.GEMP01045578.1~~GEMP01045578.1.p1  ORF type:complete len:322 (+),score=13.55 GEMP01045578.1:153-1118(+)